MPAVVKPRRGLNTRCVNTTLVLALAAFLFPARFAPADPVLETPQAAVVTFVKTPGRPNPCTVMSLTDTRAKLRFANGRTTTYVSKDIATIETMSAVLTFKSDSWQSVRKMAVNNLNVGQKGVLCSPTGGPAIGKVLQVLDKDNMLVTVGVELVWVRASTTNAVTDKVFPLAGIWEVVGTQTYETRAGTSRTVHIVSPKP